MALYSLSRLITLDEFPFSEHLQGNIALDFFSKLYYENATVFNDGNQLVVGVDLFLEEPMLLPVPLLNNFKIDIGSNIEEETVFNTTIGIGLNPFLDIRDIPIKLHIGKELLQPLDSNGNADPSRDHTELNLGLISVYVDKTGIYFDEEVAVDIPLSGIGNTGLKIKIDDLTVDLTATTPALEFRSCQLILPEYFIIPESTKIFLEQAKVSTSGFSGTTAIELPLSYTESEKKFKYNDQDSTILGIPGGLRKVEIIIENNQPTVFNLEGQLLIPYFDVPVDVTFTIAQNGDITTSIKSVNGSDIVLKKDELIAFYIQSLQLKKQGELGSITLSGGLEPMLYANEGMKWPRMDVKNLNLDSNGKFSIDEAWLDLKDMATLDLFGFHLELRKIGIGSLLEQGTDKLWIDLSGALKLIEQVPIGLDIEGFRIIWPQSLSMPDNITPQTLQQFASQLGIQFKGVQFSFGVPNALKIDGLIRFFKDENAVGFAGDMILVVPPAGITAEAGLLIGMNTEPDPFVFFYVYFGLECTAGIPLGQSGLALKGALGLFGINVGPDKLPDQNWYYDWYKRAPAPGAHQTTKWTYNRGGLAVGAGVTITTVDGIVKGTKGIIVLALPGPVLVINGKALVLNGLGEGEPPFSATAIFDGREKIVQFNIEAQAELVKDTLDAYAGVEAFFDFKDITNWHLYLGQDEPTDRRIRANLLNIVEADAYLMLDMVNGNSLRSRMGASVNAKPSIPKICFDIPVIGEECIVFEAHVIMGGDGVISSQPEQFSASGFIDAGITISAVGIELEIGADASLDIEGPAPFSLQADLELYANLPDPLPDYRDDFHYELTIPEVNLDVTNPLASVSLFSRFTSESNESKIHDARSALDMPNKQDAETGYLKSMTDGIPNVPLVECDVNPVLSFEHEMNQLTSFLMHPGGVKTYEAGIIEFKPTLKKITIEQKKKSSSDGPWSMIYSTNADEAAKLIGTWLAENDPGSPERPASRRLQLMTTNPLINTMHYSGMEGFVFMQAEADKKHLSEQVVEDYPDLMFCTDGDTKPICVSFNYPGKAITKKTLFWGGIRFKHADGVTVDKSCLVSTTGLEVEFPEQVIDVVITTCTDLKELVIKAFTYPTGKKLQELIADAAKKNVEPVVKCNVTVEIRVGQNGSKITITSSQPLACLKILASKKEGIQIKSICYKTQKMLDDGAANKLTCEVNKKILTINNTTPPSPYSINENNLFEPGCYYKITVHIETTGRVKTMKEGFIQALYEAALGDVTKTFEIASYFQTEAPPQKLDSYVKWSLPYRQSVQQYISDPIFVRFKRNYLKTFFGNPGLSAYNLSAFIQDAKGMMIECKIDWSKSADAGTLFPDEQTWRQHLASNSTAEAINRDDIIKIELKDPSAKDYKTAGRYELIIGFEEPQITTSASANQWNDSLKNQKKGNAKLKPVMSGVANNKYYRVLHSYSFTTSKFTDFGAMIPLPETTAAYGMIAPLVNSNSLTNTFAAAVFNTNVKNWAEAGIKNYFTMIDYDYGMANYTNSGQTLLAKEALEKTKLLLREAKENVDESFRELALSLMPDLLFISATNKIQITALNTASPLNQDKKIAFLWIHLPETVQLMISGNISGRNYGNVSVSLTTENNTEIATDKFYNTDTSQIILQLKQSINLTAAEQRFVILFTITNDFEDDTRDNIFGTVDNKHHRYDRPSLKGIGKRNFKFKFIVKR
jgi:hypothetical protein